MAKIIPWVLLVLLARPLTAAAQENFKTENLVAWCIVPFDAAKRTPGQRAQMVKRLGMSRIAYDWRAEHVPTFEAEIEAYQSQEIEFFAFWGWHPEMISLIKKHKITPQFWLMFKEPTGKLNEQQKIEAVAKALESKVKTAQSLGCKVALYNHGGWAGKPETLVALTQWFRRKGMNHVGIVYNFHHAHEEIPQFEQQLTKMLPYLFCLNLNGMNPSAKPKIMDIGSGQHEREMIVSVLKANYSGPIGILDHRPTEDAERVLRQNLAGLKQLLVELKARVD